MLRAHKVSAVGGFWIVSKKDEMDKRVGVGVGVMLLRDNKVLLGKRHNDPKKADSELHGEGTWTMPGGKLHFGETFEETGAREVFEETGIKINKEDFRVISLTDDIVEDAHFVTIGLLSERFEGKAKVMEPDEITEWQWFSLNELPSLIFFPSEKMLKNYFDREFYRH